MVYIKRQKKNIFTLCIVLCCFTVFSACNSSSTNGGSDKQASLINPDSIPSNGLLSKVEFKNLIHDFGNIRYGEELGCYFKYTNVGDNPLYIKNVDVGCACTSVDYPKGIIKPGESDFIELKFDSHGFSGNQYKVVQVTFNTHPATVDLGIAAFVE